MLQSMTGFGNATNQSDAGHVAVELKAVNNRYLKVSMRLPDFLSGFEPDIEKLIREEIARGSVQLSVRAKLNTVNSGFSLDQTVLASYVEQIRKAQAEVSEEEQEGPDLLSLLHLPGVISEAEVDATALKSLWPLVEKTLQDALLHFHQFRNREGESMRIDLANQCEQIRQQVAAVSKLAPEVVKAYREKLLERLEKALNETEATVAESDVIREVAVFADKCDINEEITRLTSHLAQFDDFLNAPESMGRKLEFLGQEMFREINTIGSKANNVSIAHCVVEMKAAIERIREVLQNVA